MVSPVAMAFLQGSGWYDDLWTYSCLLVFFMCVLMSRMPVSVKVGPLYTVISRKVSSLSSHSWVNLMVGWVELILSMKVCRSSLEPVQI